MSNLGLENDGSCLANLKLYVTMIFITGHVLIKFSHDDKLNLFVDRTWSRVKRYDPKSIRNLSIQYISLHYKSLVAPLARF